MSLLADLLTTISERRYVPFNLAGRSNKSIEALCDELLTSHGEVSGGALTRLILDAYGELDDAGRKAFFTYLCQTLDLDVAEVRTALDAYEADPNRATYRDLMIKAEPRRQEVIRRLNQVPGATGRLVQMRADLLRLSRDEPELAVLDLDFRHLFQSWFNRGFLVLKPVNWDSPAQILEKIIAYEAVHAIHSWGDLRRRVEPTDRRCFAFFHPSMPDEPLIFVEVALTRGIPSSIQQLLAEGRSPMEADAADTAVFYSISNCQDGLAGISFGNSLIKQVVRDLSRELPELKTFVTLSPIPTLSRWMNGEGHEVSPEDPEALRKLAAYYLAEVKGSGGWPRDPVARFHLTNGAQLHDIHAGADTSENGQEQSAGAMVNYLYDRARISQNHETFVNSHTIPASPKVRSLVRAALKSEQQGTK